MVVRNESLEENNDFERHIFPFFPFCLLPWRCSLLLSYYLTPPSSPFFSSSPLSPSFLCAAPVLAGRRVSRSCSIYSLLWLLWPRSIYDRLHMGPVCTHTPWRTLHNILTFHQRHTWNSLYGPFYICKQKWERIQNGRRIQGHTRWEPAVGGKPVLVAWGGCVQRRCQQIHLYR